MQKYPTGTVKSDALGHRNNFSLKWITIRRKLTKLQNSLAAQRCKVLLQIHHGLSWPASILSRTVTYPRRCREGQGTAKLFPVTAVLLFPLLCSHRNQKADSRFGASKLQPPQDFSAGWPRRSTHYEAEGVCKSEWTRGPRTHRVGSSQAQHPWPVKEGCHALTNHGGVRFEGG